MGKQSFYELEANKNAFQSFFSKDRKYDRNLVYAVRKNISRINSEQELIKKDLPDNAEGFIDYNDKRFNILLECGAKASQLPNGGARISDTSELDEEKANKEIEKLNEEYEKVIEEQSKIVEEKEKILNDKLAEVDYYKIKLEYFPEEVEFDEIPQALIDIIED